MPQIYARLVEALCVDRASRHRASTSQRILYGPKARRPMTRWRPMRNNNCPSKTSGRTNDHHGPRRSRARRPMQTLITSKRRTQNRQVDRSDGAASHLAGGSPKPKSFRIPPPTTSARTASPRRDRFGGQRMLRANQETCSSLSKIIFTATRQ
jgi:hypothetical protein